MDRIIITVSSFIVWPIFATISIAVMLLLFIVVWFLIPFGIFVKSKEDGTGYTFEVPWFQNNE